MKRLAIVAAVLSLVGGAVFLRAYYLVTFAVGYGIASADRNQLIYLIGTITCALLLVALGGYLLGRKVVKKS
jgi:uncharacterized protein YneF (UPF0154 family)